MKKSWLGEGGTNLFQEIKAVCAETEFAGQTLYRLSIGEPSGSAFREARQATAEAVMAYREAMHRYQDNGSPGVPYFAERFVSQHVATDLTGKDVAYLPIPGIKSVLGLIPLACGCGQRQKLRVLTTVAPGYPTPATWCGYLGVPNGAATLTSANGFRFDPKEIETTEAGLVMANYPHNATAQVATREWWESVCRVAERRGVRIFNDAAYSALAYDDGHCTLSDVAINYPELSWAEAFSASKAGNFTGWRIAAMVGSPDFIGDIATIKGNTDSGFFAPAAVGVIHVFENHSHLVRGAMKIYRRRSRLLQKVLLGRGMRLAVEPKAGFFTLWKIPNTAFDERIVSAVHFNLLMIERTGVVGVPFDPYIRYAVCGDVESMIGPIGEAFDKAEVAYDE